ncbi:MAG: Transcriptional regulator, PaaX family [Candidatus Moranbacteria bacterium GW2011_GWE2_35_2-]|nr:MAG: Transcriptional regulator, PaaX family [Candidatus Moranbacteria bacterium GW2011_GWE2_35_2-]KKQ05603.1 MAG: Transcriptional regulator, PaaX family [Candidatus Moranbacteria bacterium GW2011_GWF1_36_4]KKQ22237.1 MAG: Transcriptional regulator, PaaX family [Candidatus Moranbacteria bacterium GW2011_GWF2_37_11]KKQ28606.1 MAG: Transcriptional regulator, PaaX family [Candidatus Moranbacteria bacterium GW2011_GWD1_37_17]KKQ30271.1 MAG: Transcriptional regulator, PaaX family [Candidatus Moran
MSKNDKNIAEKRFAKKILDNSISAGVWIFSNLALFGEATIEIFLNPSYYNDPLDGFSGRGVIDFEKLKNKKFQEKTIRQSIRRLQKQGFVKKEGSSFLLTEKGRNILDYVLKRKKVLDKKWDKKYRVVIFDIPEDMRKDRDWLRGELYLLNYKQLQKSVFMSKYPLTSDLIREIKMRKIGNYVDYMLVEKIYSIKD